MTSAVVGVADEADRSVAVVVFKALRQHELRADEQQLPSVHLEEVRAFPHQAEAPVVFDEHALKAPGQRVVAAVKQQTAFLLLVAGTDDAAIAAVFFAPDLGVSEIEGAQAVRQAVAADHGILLELLVVDAVAQGEALHLQRFLAVVTELADAGVYQKLLAVRQFDGAAGPAAVRVVPLVRGERGRQVAPVQQVRAYGVAPVHIVPLGFVGVVLIKEMIFPLIIGETVGVVHPAHAGRQMELRARVLRDTRQRVLLVGPGEEQSLLHVYILIFLFSWFPE